MQSSHGAAVTILCAHMSFWIHDLESDTVWYITFVKGVERCCTVREIDHDIIHDVSILIKQIKLLQFFAHRQKCRDISSMPTAAWCELAIRISIEKTFLIGKLDLATYQSYFSLALVIYLVEKSMALKVHISFREKDGICYDRIIVQCCLFFHKFTITL